MVYPKLTKRISIELQVGILAASLPTLRPIFIKLLKGASTAVLPSGDTSRYGYGYGPTDRSKTCHCGEPQYSWSVQDRGPNYLPRENLQIPLDSVAVSSGHGDIGGDNVGDRNNDPRSHYKAQVSSSSGGVRHYASEDREKSRALLPPGGGIHVLKQTEVMYNTGKDHAADETGEKS
ncbi:hypothetical protein PG984_011730 [Apiospora sp. TS-2023a]